MVNNLKIRPANLNDLPRIVDIYNQAIRSGTATGTMVEFTVEERVEWFQKFDVDSFPIYVAEQDNKVVGYASLSPYRTNHQQPFTLHLIAADKRHTQAVRGGNLFNTPSALRRQIRVETTRPLDSNHAHSTAAEPPEPQPWPSILPGGFCCKL